MSRRYVTVSIPYVNAAPHLGYALELVEADALVRLWRSQGDEVRFLGGTDDHALKNVLAAEAEGTPTQDFVDRNAARFLALKEPLNVSFDDFIRTSRDPRHRPGVERLWHRTAGNGDFYQQFYEGLYCVGCEQFYAPEDLSDGRCPEHGAVLEHVGEQNWFFRLSRYQAEIEELLASGRLEVLPEVYGREALAFVRSGLQDFSVSRSQARARGWGLSVPGDPSQVIYVWWDALANYVTALGYGTNDDAYRRWWIEAEQRTHVIGKGILRFHAVYWPALLLSAGEPPPTRIFVHPYLTANGQKLSKTTGNVIDPLEVVADFGTDALRWWLLHNVPRNTDADFTAEGLVASANADLANGIGNLTSRLITLIHRYRGGRVQTPAAHPFDTVIPISAAINRFDFHTATALTAELIDNANQHIEMARPWELARSTADTQRLDDVLGSLVLQVRSIAAALDALTPDLASRVRAALQPDQDGYIPSPHGVFPRLPPVEAT